MKKEHIRIYIGQLMLLTVLSAGWWGILYPNFSLTQDTFRTTADENDKSVISEKDGQESRISSAEGFRALLEADAGEIRIRSRLLDAVAEIRGKENGNQ